MDGKPALVEVQGMTASGEAWGMVDRRRVTIDYAIPGELVEVTPRPRARPEPGTELVRVVRPSPHRVVPRCPYFGPCGGCSWQHVEYAEQLRLKERLLASLLEEALGAPVTVHPVLTGNGAQWGYRNKVHFVVAPASTRGGLVLGHYRRNSREVIAVGECPVHDDEGNRVAFALADALRRSGIDGATPDGLRGIARHVVVRVTLAPAETLATLVVTRNDKRLRPALRSAAEAPGAPDGLAVNVHTRADSYLFGDETRHLDGRRRVRETVAGLSFLISPTSFFQTNVRAAEAMVRFVLDQAAGVRTAVDLYAGSGLFALPLAARGVRVTAIEENPTAVEDGEASREFNRIAKSTCRFVCMRAEAVADPRGRSRSLPASPDLVVLDPPRAGCPRHVLDWICRSLAPERLIYVSCNPEALAVDLRIPLGARYRLRQVQPVDMFPHTAHIETVAVLDRR